MAVNPMILARIFGGAPQEGQDPGVQQQVGLRSLGAMGAAMLAGSTTNTGNAPTFGQVLGQGLQAGYAAQAAGQQNAQLAQMRQMAMAQQKQALAQKAKQAEAIQRMLGGTQPTVYGEAAPIQREGLAEAQGQVFAGSGIDPTALAGSITAGQGQISPGMPAPEGGAGVLAGLPPQTQQLIMAMSPEQQMATLSKMMFTPPSEDPAKIQVAREIAKENGWSLGQTLQWMEDKSGQDVNVSVGGPAMYMPEQETKFAETMGTGYANQVIDLQKKAIGAADIASKASEINQVLSGLETGALSGVKMTVGRLVSDFGIDPVALGLPSEGDLSKMETATALQNMLALTVRSPESGMGMPGSVSNRDIQFLLNSVPNLKQSPAGRQLLVDILNQRADFLGFLAKTQSDYMRNNAARPGQSDQGWLAFRAQAIEQYDGFEKLRNEAQAIMHDSIRQPIIDDGATVIENPVDQPIDDLVNDLLSR